MPFRAKDLTQNYVPFVDQPDARNARAPWSAGGGMEFAEAVVAARLTTVMDMEGLPRRR
jgi:hypothetical protein